VSCGVVCRCGSDPVLLWLWCRPVATAPIGPLAWESPYAAGAAQEIAKKKKDLYPFPQSPAGQESRLKTLPCCGCRNDARMHLAKDVTPECLWGFSNPSQSMEAQTQAVLTVGHGHPQSSYFCLHHGPSSLLEA